MAMGLGQEHLVAGGHEVGGERRVPVPLRRGEPGVLPGTASSSVPAQYMIVRVRWCGQNVAWYVFHSR